MGVSHSGKLRKILKMDRKSNAQNVNTEKDSDDNSSTVRPLSIEGPRAQPNPNQREMHQNQPRQPANLQGLLRFAMEATNSEDTPNHSVLHPIDDERKEFLNNALSSMTVNIIEELQKHIKLLYNVTELRNEDDPSEYETALDNIADRADSMDIANDFYKIGGFSIFEPCLNSIHSGIRWRVANVIAELTQNNPFCQEKILQAGYLPTLLNMVDSDTSDLTRIKALYAISCIVRENAIALKYMEVNDGYSVLMRAIQSSIAKLQIKSAFLLSSLCNKDQNNELKFILIKMGLIEQAAGLLALGNSLTETKEQLLNMLNSLTNNNYSPALKECQRSELCFKKTLERHLQESKEEESIEREDLCKQLLDKVFADKEIEQER